MRCPDCGKFVPYDTEVDPEEAGEASASAEEYVAASSMDELT